MMLKKSKYLRISVTNTCNLSCFYCHKEGNHSLDQNMLSPKEIQTLCRIGLAMGYEKFKLTGGEPTMRRDICEIISRLAALGLPDLSMITNGTTLADQAADLWKAGLRRVNVTLNTLNPKRFQSIQGSGAVSVDAILEGISAAKRVGFQNIKMNFVYFDDDSEKDLKELLNFSGECGCTLVVLHVLSKQSFYSLDFLYYKLQSYGIAKEELIVDREGIRKRLIQMKSGAVALLRMDELADRKPYVFCSDCADRKECREGIFPVRVSANGELIPCMASLKHRIPIAHLLADPNEAAIRQAFSTIEGWCCPCE